MAVYVDDVSPEILVNVPLFNDDCHWIVPVLPLRVSAVLFVLVQTADEPAIVPPAVAGGTVKVIILLMRVVTPEKAFLL